MGLFGNISLLGVLAITTAIIFAAIMFGVVVGRHFRHHFSADEAPPVGTLVGALFALLAFLLALTYSATSNRFEDRKQLLLDEVNAVGTAYLRADFLSAAPKAKSKELLRDYVTLRANVLRDSESINQLIASSEQLHKALWSEAVSAIQEHNGPAQIAYANALNDVFDLHTSRVIVGLNYHIHDTVWIILLVVSVLAMSAIGFQFGYSGGRRITLCLLLALTFSLVLSMIEDLDRPLEGSITIDQGSMQTLLNSLD